MQTDNYRTLLKEELERRKDLNPSYSLRSFARDLGISAPMLSQVLSSKAGLSNEAAKKIAHKLKFNASDADLFTTSVAAQHSRSTKERLEHIERFNRHKENAKAFSSIQLDYFKVISDWYHFAILELTHLKDFNSDPTWIAQCLDIEVEQVAEAIERLYKLELIEKTGNGFKDVFTQLATPNDIPSASLRKYNGQILKKASEALSQQSVDEREISSTILSISKKNLPQLKERLREFRRTVDHGLETDEKDSVYCLNINFFNLTHTKEERP